MGFSAENIYIIVEDYFNLPDRYVLSEGKAEEAKNIIGALDLKRFEKKGACVFICRLLGPADWGREDEDYEMILSDNGANYSFEVIDCLDMFPRIEGDFKPGIYPDRYFGAHYELKTVDDLSELYSRYIENGVGFDEFKVVCKENQLEVILLEGGTEKTLETVPAYPFSYFDIYCPICSKKIVTYELMASDAIRCAIKQVKCEHYMGRIEKQDNQFSKPSLKYLGIPHKIQNEELFLLTDAGWKKLIAYSPPIDSAKSYWGASGGDNFTDVFLFVEMGLI